MEKGIIKQSCPFLPAYENGRRKAHGLRRGADFYMDALSFAQGYWMEGKPAQAILQLNKAFSADLSLDAAILSDWPWPYAALEWILDHAADGGAGFLGNPVRHFQHLATRMTGPRCQARVAHAWHCFHISRRILQGRGDFPLDGRQMAREGIFIPANAGRVCPRRKASDHGGAYKEAGKLSKKSTMPWCSEELSKDMFPREQKIFTKSSTSLKICGITIEADALRMIEMGVDALGFNFWPHSKRYLDPVQGVWLKGLAGKIERVGVFVNETSDLPYRLYAEGIIDIVQLHGDETPQQVAGFQKANIPVIKAIGIRNVEDITMAGAYQADAILLDTHAPQVFGGTGETFDWSLAKEFARQFPDMPMILAGGITPNNAEQAVTELHPSALDVASGAEISPGIKDPHKVAALVAACKNAS
jgi:phosphoribosylanthranilate isomerase